MTNDRVLFLLILQCAALVALLLHDFYGGLTEIVRVGASAALLITTGLLLINRFRTRSRLKDMQTELRRAINGNLKTRLFAQGDPLLDEVTFSINELIEQLEQVQVQTIQSEAARRSLLSSISHDIRTPLTSVIGYVDALKDDIAVSAEEKLEYLEIISRKSKGLKQLIDEIFTMAKLDADEMPMKPESLDLAELARESLIEFLPDLKKYGIELKVSMPEDACVIIADRLSLMRIMGNIMKNAIHYGQAGRILGVELAETDRDYQLLIWDQGPGISKADIGNVFERMFRSDQSRNPSQGGSGLGLAIAKALVEKNGGKIWVESVPWERTTFGFSIPKQHHPYRF
ncbi:sensor histidine kinase [Brevibacillus dissolubilis]|uniref:sensor histidine kinase n=1 Tax=Brevibacillus dissolubilis TaxID=1844116 RepID=UPI0011177529|nr:HAMP domain-containing sensor histidine kinase [Brevibacillus dissolubilis]